MKNILIILCLILFSFPGSSSKNPGNEWVLDSPDKQVKFTVIHKKVPGDEGLDDRLFYKVIFHGKDAVLESPLGIEREDVAFVSNLKPVAVSKVKLIDEKYSLKTGKCSEVHNNAKEQVLTFKNRKGDRLELVIKVYNDGVAFCYRFPDNNPALHKILKEQTGFSLPKNGKAWIHPYDWNSRKKPSYEQYCQKEIGIGTASPNEKGWAYPMLFNANGLWILVTEALLDGSWCGTHIQTTPNGMYLVSLAEPEEAVIPDPPEPVHSLPWSSPWRVIILGDNLASIVETNMVQHLNKPCMLENTDWIRPGRASWSWWSDGGSPRDFKKQMDYVDFTAGMGWEYMLIDAGWPEMKGGSVEDVIKYANNRNVGIWLWYHSGAGIQQDSATVRNLMSIPESRCAEFARLQSLGVKGVKVDFFDTDKQNVVR
jgi:alpha-glucosidase